jgi:uncharacterized protein (DUF362 family)
MNHSPRTTAREQRAPGRARVALVRCASYEPAALSSSVLRSFDLAGGWSALPGPGAKVFVKINHLSPHAPPDRAVCTHPAFVREVLRVLLERKARVTVGDDVISALATSSRRPASAGCAPSWASRSST